MVLAIGIVVTTPSWWRGGEATMEEDHSLSVADATKKAMETHHRADHRHHPGAALGFRAAAFIPASRANCSGSSR